MLQASAQLLTARMFAAMVVLSVFAVGLFALIALVERRVAWWGPHQSAEHALAAPSAVTSRSAS